MIKTFHANFSAQLATLNFQMARNPNVPNEHCGKLLERGIAYGRAAGNPGALHPALKGLRVEPPSEHASQIEAFAEEVQGVSVTHSECQPAGILRITISGEMFGIPKSFERLSRCRRIEIVFDSVGGGSPWEMIAMLSGHSVITHVSGLALSAAALLSQAGARRTISPNGRIMLHPPVRAVIGGAAKLREAAEYLEFETAKDVDFLTQRTGQPREVVEAWLSGPDVWFDSAQALAAGLVDEIIE